MNEQQRSVLNVVEELRGNLKFSDFTVKCGEKVFQVHRAVICGQSKYFEIACKGDTFKEGDQKTIVIPATASYRETTSGSHPNAVQAVMDYCYGVTKYNGDRPTDVSAKR
ncbi:Hypothetical protein D9617_2g059800 [Elsinoe fawcettii]|nr:Hypothetical protein D9617_2g059800 [Elsinoe fawcettii]